VSKPVQTKVNCSSNFHIVVTFFPQIPSSSWLLYVDPVTFFLQELYVILLNLQATGPPFILCHAPPLNIGKSTYTYRGKTTERLGQHCQRKITFIEDIAAGTIFQE
jgi:hypothetical protein